MFGRKKPIKILMVADWDNLIYNLKMPAPEKLSKIAGLDRVQKEITQEVGEIVDVFVFTPHLIYLDSETLYNEGFYIVLCPRVRTKTGTEDRDTVDETIIKFVNDMVTRMPDITHICLGSGDKDFCRMLRGTIRKRLKIMLMVGDLTSLSADLIDLADINPLTGTRMIYILSSTKE